MRLTRDARRKGLTLVPSLRRERDVVGIADSVARAVTLGPGVLPAGIADAVLRLAFGRGAGLEPVVDGADGQPAGDDDNGHLLDFLRARAARIQLTRQPRDGEGD